MTNKNLAQNETSYDTGNKPFKHDVGRGKWAENWHFYAVSLSYCFGFNQFEMHFLLYEPSAVTVFISYLLGMLTFTLPLYFTQMFLGQFSRSGTISAFRIAPLFKGIGYLSLFLNLLTSSYVMVMAAFPLYVIFESLQPSLPWAHCNNTYNTENCVDIHVDFGPFEYGSPSNSSADFENKTIAVKEYISSILGTPNSPDQWFLLWRVVLCVFLVWILIALVHIKGIELFGKIFRFTTATMFICIFLTTIRILCVAESWTTIKDIFDMKRIRLRELPSIIFSPLTAVTTFGVGWGNVLTISSYNNFKTDIGKLSLVTCSTQVFIFFIATLNYIIVDVSLRDYEHFDYSSFSLNYDQTVIYAFEKMTLYFSHLSWPNFWTILYFLAIFLSQFAEGAIQILTILTAIFDEFEYTRIYKKVILGGLIGSLGIISIFFCTKSGFLSIQSLYEAATFNKLFIIVIELIVILWIYGRVRFQRDVKFMTGKVIQSWKIWMMRFLTPILVLLSMVFYGFLFHFSMQFGNLSEVIMSILILKLLPLLHTPGYIIYKIYSSTGGILDRIRRLCRPNDWYPADPIDHQNYENYLGNSDMTNELVDVNMDSEENSFYL